MNKDEEVFWNEKEERVECPKCHNWVSIREFYQKNTKVYVPAIALGIFLVYASIVLNIGWEISVLSAFLPALTFVLFFLDRKTALWK